MFETDEGAGELVSSDHLKSLIEKSKYSFEIVIVAACQSELIGKVFLEGGAKNVICIDQK